MIRRLLTVDATRRARMDEVRMDPWVNEGYDHPPRRYGSTSTSTINTLTSSASSNTSSHQTTRPLSVPSPVVTVTPSQESATLPPSKDKALATTPDSQPLSSTATNNAPAIHDSQSEHTLATKGSGSDISNGSGLNLQAITSEPIPKQHVPVLMPKLEEIATPPSTTTSTAYSTSFSPSQFSANEPVNNEGRLRSVSLPATHVPVPVQGTSVNLASSALHTYEEDEEAEDKVEELTSSMTSTRISDNATSTNSTANAAPRRRFSLDGAMKAIGATLKPQKTSPVTTEKQSPDHAVRTLKGWFNSATTSSKSPDEIIEEVIRVLRANNVEYEQSGYIISAWQTLDGKKTLRMEFEVCHIPRLSLNGLHLKRLMGDMWAYKKFCTEMLLQMKL